MLAVSLLVHIVLLSLMPVVNIFPPLEIPFFEQYIEIEGILLDTEALDEQPEEGMGETEKIETEGDGVQDEEIEIPMTLEPIEPEMMGERSRMTELDTPVPERAFSLPKVLEALNVTARPRQDVLLEDTEPVAVELAVLKERSKPQPEIFAMASLPKKLEGSSPHDVTSRVEPPPREVRTLQKSIEQEIEPELKMFESTEFLDQDNMEIVPKSELLSRRAPPTNPPPARREFRQNEPSRLSRSPTRLPEAKALPEPDEEEIVFKEDETTLAMNIETPLKNSSFSEPEPNFFPPPFPELTETQPTEPIPERVAMLRSPLRPTLPPVEREFRQNEPSKLTELHVRLPETKALPEPDEQEVVFKEDENAFAMNVEVPPEDSSSDEPEPDFQPRSFPQLPETQPEDTIPERVVMLRSSLRPTPSPVERELQQNKLSEPMMSHIRLPEIKAFPEPDEEEIVFKEEEDVLAMNAELPLEDSLVSEPNFLSRPFPELPETQLEDMVPERVAMLRSPAYPIAPPVTERLLQRDEQKRPEILDTQLSKSKTLPELRHENSEIKVEENDADSLAKIIDSPSTLFEEGMKVPGPQISFPQKLTDIPTSSGTLVKSEQMVKVESPVRPFSQMRTIKLLQEEPQEGKIIPSFQNLSSVPIPPPLTRLQEQAKQLVMHDNDEKSIRTAPKIELLKEVQGLEPQSLASLNRRKQISPTIPAFDRAPIKIISPVPEKQPTSESKSLFLSPKMTYAEEETAVKAVQRPPLKASRPTSVTSSTLFGIKNPKVLELQRPVSKTDAPISLFELPAAVQRSSAAVRTVTILPLEAEQTGFGLFVKKQEPKRQEPAIPEFEDSKETMQQDDTLQQIAREGAEEEVFFEIEGPASRREVIYKPLRFPEVDIDMEVSIRLQFWILADGTVGEVVPLQRGDLRLERAATQYLKNWLFTPVSSEQEMWGVVPITYKLR